MKSTQINMADIAKMHVSIHSGFTVLNIMYTNLYKCSGAITFDIRPLHTILDIHINEL